MEKLIITVAPTGAVTTKENNPNIPLQPEEIANEVYECYKAGASIAHIHVRDEYGNPSMDKEIFKKTVKLIRDRCDILLNLTSSGGRGLPLTDEDRFIHMIELKPEMGSFDAGSMNFGERVFVNSPQFLEKLAKAMYENNVKPEIEVFDTGMIYNALRLADKGLIKKPMHFQFVLGVRGGAPGDVKHLLHMIECIPEGSTWSAVGIGKSHLPLATLAIHMGGHVRVGLEDNVMYKKGVLAESNVQFVKRIVHLAEMFDRPIASVEDARRILSITK